MKASEYESKIVEYCRDPIKALQRTYQGVPEGTTPEQCNSVDVCLAVCLDMLEESKTIMKQRKCESGSAKEAVLREQNQKWIAVIRGLRKSRLGTEFLEEIKFPESFFKQVVVEYYPTLINYINSRWPGGVVRKLVHEE
jgi:hypothetical protein